MGQPRPISLFAHEPATHQQPYSYMVSVFLHLIVAGLILYGFIFAPRINMKEAVERYTLRQVDLASEDLERPQSAPKGMYPGQTGAAPNAAAHQEAAAAAASLRQIPKLHLADRTVVQPDIPVSPVQLKKVQLPSLLLWSQTKPNVKLLQAPQAEKMANINAKPLLTRPTQQVNVSDVPITPTQFTSNKPMPLPSSSTPVEVRGPDLAQRIPHTSVDIPVDSPSGAVMSIAETRLVQGRLYVPPVNQTAAGNANGSLGTGKTGNAAQNGTGNGQGAQNGSPQSKGTGGGNTAGNAGNPHGTVAGGAGNSGTGAGAGNGKNKAGVGGGQGGAGQGTEPSFSRLTLPPNGQFGVVVVGSSMTDEFPETATLWGARLIYSVYLHVGLARNWVLQYSLPTDVEASSGGTMTKVDAPWPYYMVRPNEAPERVNADALMVHGFINEGGHFETLTVVVPPGYRRGQAVLAALDQWKFRPAKHNGRACRVEVLVIIPEDSY
ncbi:MAG: hypothetical protein P4L40_10400 [Terracidiphilus sp.]|nr:hypothetical protein [Terracidiphilus sp.]